MSASSALYVGRARHWAKTLEDREAGRRVVSIEEARPHVARQTGVMPGTLENLRRGRLTEVAAHVYERLRAAVVRELLAEKARIDHELQVARQTGLDPRGREVAALEADEALIRQALGLEGGQ